MVVSKAWTGSKAGQLRCRCVNTGPMSADIGNLLGNLATQVPEAISAARLTRRWRMLIETDLACKERVLMGCTLICDYRKQRWPPRQQRT